ncbi:MAG TPA: type II toxin-antitoxin system HicB family antitoxin [Candidatus Nitrosotenuis sp.]|jgi:predicted RNase H-like HicB family nuclease
METTMKFTNNVGKRKFTMLVQEEPEGGFTGKCLELRGAISYGKTMKELKANMKDAIALILDTLEEEAEKGNYRKEVIEISS